ncbi:MAG: FIST C-terminal domain-containing protein [Planctomycetia bacterium]|nr:FIST C-terminal domain-containing protein [Planctomycetia bacterium]
MSESTHPPAPDRPRFAAALSTEADTRRAIAEVCRRATAQLGARPDLAMCFISPHHGPDWAAVAADLQTRTQARCLLGATGEAIVGGSREIEAEPAVSLWLASLPGVRVTSLRLDFVRTAEGGSIVGWPDALAGDWPAGATMLVLAEPFTFPADWLLARLNEDRPGTRVLGGMASGGHAPGENCLLVGGQVVAEGAVGVLLDGPIDIRSVVSQGCRPIGPTYVVTKAEQNLILELGGRPALAQLRKLFDALPAEEQKLVNRGLHVGRAINEYQGSFARGDFLIRNCLGIDASTDCIAVGDFFRPGHTVQFHVRDERTADEDLRELLTAAREDAARDGIAGQAALLFTCNGRGTRLFSCPDHDAATIAEILGDLPVAGFFAQGEMGPVGGKNFLHGFTAAVAIVGGRGLGD